MNCYYMVSNKSTFFSDKGILTSLESTIVPIVTVVISGSSRCPPSLLTRHVWPVTNKLIGVISSVKIYKILFNGNFNSYNVASFFWCHISDVETLGSNVSQKKTQQIGPTNCKGNDDWIVIKNADWNTIISLIRKTVRHDFRLMLLKTPFSNVHFSYNKVWDKEGKKDNTRRLKERKCQIAITIR